MSDHSEQLREALARIKSVGGRAADAHDHSSAHRPEIESSTVLGCFYCCQNYSPSLIEEWVDDDSTALCPKCGIDSVIGNASGFPVDDRSFLVEMRELWFNGC